MVSFKTLGTAVPKPLLLAAGAGNGAEMHRVVPYPTASGRVTVSRGFCGINVRELHPHIYSTVPLTPLVAPDWGNITTCLNIYLVCYIYAFCLLHFQRRMCYMVPAQGVMSRRHIHYAVCPDALI